jgi:hypothetical protein
VQISTRNEQIRLNRRRKGSFSGGETHQYQNVCCLKGWNLIDGEKVLTSEVSQEWLDGL